ncbi:MAG: CpsD/CapB family tyrosine-protein kinase [Pirellulales bacterium]
MIARSPTSAAARNGAPPCDNALDMLADHCRAVWNRLYSLGEQAPRLIGVTGSARGEGVTTVAAHLALAAADAANRHKVLLVDANLRHPAAHTRLNGESGPGLAEILAGQAEWKEAVQKIKPSGISLLAAGTARRDTATASDLVCCQDLFRELQAEFDVVLIDLPAVGHVGLTLPVAGNLDGTILVVEAEVTPTEDAQRSAQLLSDAQARLLGVVLNKRRELLPRWLRR